MESAALGLDPSGAAMIGWSRDISMKPRNLTTIMISAILSAIAAVIFCNHIPMMIAAHDPKIAPDFVVAPVSFIGALIASSFFVKNGSRSLGSAVIFIILVDLFAALTFSAVLIPWYWYWMIFAAASGGYVLFCIFMLPVGTIFIPVLALTLGNFITVGVGFVMALPALLWLWMRHCPIARDMSAEPPRHGPDQAPQS